MDNEIEIIGISDYKSREIPPLKWRECINKYLITIKPQLRACKKNYLAGIALRFWSGLDALTMQVGKGKRRLRARDETLKMWAEEQKRHIRPIPG